MIWYTEKNLFVNFTLFIRKIYYFYIIVALGHTRNVGFLLVKNSHFYDFRSKFQFLNNNFFNSKDPTFQVCPSVTIEIINFLIKKSKVYK